jgi:hypothetical protein
MDLIEKKTSKVIKFYIAGILLISVALAYMAILFSESVSDLASNKIPYYQIPQYMISFIIRFIASVGVLIIGLILLVIGDIRNVIGRLR